MSKNIVLTLTTVLMLLGCIATQANLKLDKSIIEYRTKNEQATMINASDA